MQQEFDQYINNYRINQDAALSLSGETSNFFAHYKAKKLASWLKNLTHTSASILDFGCGDGVMTHFVQQEFCNAQLFGVDPSPKSIEIAQQQYPTINFKVNSDQTTKLDFNSEMFDIVYAAGAFHHIPFDLHQGYLAELYRVTKINGSMVLFELNPLNPLTRRTFRKNPIDQHAKMLWPWYAHKISQLYGSSSIKFYCFYPHALRWLRWTEPFLTKIPLGALYAIVITKQKTIN